jgi:predicted exporter
MRWGRLAVAGGALILVGLGFAGLRLDVDVFNLLPADSPMVDGLRIYQQNFGSSRELMLSLRAPEGETAAAQAESLADHLRGSGVAPEIVWQSPLGQEPVQFGELIAYLWFNQPPATFARLESRFDEGGLQSTLDGSFERMATSLNPQEVARLSRDPFALSELPPELRLPIDRGVGDPFASADGSFRILFIPSPDPEAGFWRDRRWTRRVAAEVERWRQAAPDRRDIVIRLTGTPAFVSEVGSGLLQDMQLAALGTLVLVAGLFWLVHRRWLPLLWLVALLVFVIVACVALGSLLLGTLHAVSLGFAAILLGLAADYGLILYQEFVAHPQRRYSEHRAAVAPSILWAAVTTAGAFFMIGRSSLPGMTQLGILVGIGILVAAAVMLAAFLPPLIPRIRETAPLTTGLPDTSSSAAGSRAAAWATAIIGAAAIGILALGLPGVDYGTQELGPRDARARAALQEIHEEIGGFDDALWLIVSGEDEGEVALRLEAVEPILERAKADGRLSAYSLPSALWPQLENQAANQELAGRLAERLDAARAAALEAGYTETSLALTEQVFGAWRRFAAEQAPLRPTHPGSRWLFRQFSASHAARWLALGQLEAAPSTTDEELMRLAGEVLDEVGGRLFAWSLLSNSLLGVLERDLSRVLLPMAAALILLLGLAFRRLPEVVLSFAALTFSLLCLLAVMGVVGWSWNLMNVMALPLLFGAAVDYGIHIQLALQRYRGNIAQVRRTVGRAILLCGASTACGFGTLGLASNAGLASLGRVCAVGVAIACLVSVFLLPVWWRALDGRT